MLDLSMGTVLLKDTSLIDAFFTLFFFYPTFFIFFLEHSVRCYAEYKEGGERGKSPFLALTGQCKVRDLVLGICG